jgi:hypothetical protein
VLVYIKAWMTRSFDPGELTSTVDELARFYFFFLLFFLYFLFLKISFRLFFSFILGLASMSAVLPPLVEIGEGEGRLRVNANAKERTIGRRIIKSPHYTARREKPVLPRRQQQQQGPAVHEKTQKQRRRCKQRNWGALQGRIKINIK